MQITIYFILLFISGVYGIRKLHKTVNTFSKNKDSFKIHFKFWIWLLLIGYCVYVRYLQTMETNGLLEPLLQQGHNGDGYFGPTSTCRLLGLCPNSSLLRRNGVSRNNFWKGSKWTKELCPKTDSSKRN